MRRFLLTPIVVLVTLAAVPSAASASTCPDADLAVTALNVPRAEAAVRCMVDAERTTRGLAPLAADRLLDAAALVHGLDMVARDFFAHDAPSPAPNGTSAGDRIARFGYAAWAWGENLAAGHTTPRAVMRGWMESDGHCRNVLNPDVTEIGLGIVVPDGGGRIHWVQAFGLPAETSAPVAPGDTQEACPVAELAAGPVAYTPPAGTTTTPVATPRAGTARRPVIRFSTRSLSRKRLRVTGRVVRPGAVTRVRITVRRGKARRVTTARLTRRTGAFRATLRTPAGKGPIRITVATR